MQGSPPPPPRPLLPPPPPPSPPPMWGFPPPLVPRDSMPRCRRTGLLCPGGAAPDPCSIMQEALQRMLAPQHRCHGMSWPPWAGPKHGPAFEHHTPATLCRYMAHQGAGGAGVITCALLVHACHAQACTYHVHGTHGVLARCHACTRVQSVRKAGAGPASPLERGRWLL